MPLKITLSPELEALLKEESTKLGQDISQFVSALLIASLFDSARIIQTERGLTIAGTRITLYDVMDYLTAGHPAQVISEKLNIADEQIQVAISYIKQHHSEVVSGYIKALEQAEDNRQYWQDRNRDHFEAIQLMPPKPGTEDLFENLHAWQTRLEMQNYLGTGRSISIS